MRDHVGYPNYYDDKKKFTKRFKKYKKVYERWHQI